MGCGSQSLCQTWSSIAALHPQWSCCRCPHPACRLCPQLTGWQYPAGVTSSMGVLRFLPVAAHMECGCGKLAPAFPWTPLVPSAAHQPYPVVHPHLTALLSFPHAAILQWVPWLRLCAVLLVLPALFQLGLDMHPPPLLWLEFLLLFTLFYRPSADTMSIFLPLVQVVRGCRCPDCQGQGCRCRQGSPKGNLKARILG